jgi:hypothetical protein
MAFAVLDCAEGKNGREWCEKMFDGHHDGLFFMAKNGEGTKVNERENYGTLFYFAIRELNNFGFENLKKVQKK